ncbi:MAG: T9SS type A sorting domain-containing protein [Candidatus Eisenbacteria bacterium]|uniref:T9SS type A sorting domain-containing protein n=1 Tax=Eiseniibacteriota bacterium TaxID=2212470 RepID=A0A956SE37_UNCEI|nr:T9SS type A sorting domain-containing protein [Candidatus Eisenbacteria bacterium]
MGPSVFFRSAVTCLMLALIPASAAHSRGPESIPSTWEGLDQLVTEDPTLDSLYPRGDLGMSRDPGVDDYWIGFDAPGTSGTVFAIDDYQGQLIVGGTFLRSGSIVSNGIARWDGMEWAGFGQGFSESAPGSFVGPRDLLTSGDTLWVAGSFNDIDGVAVRNVALFDGTQWTSLGAGVEGDLRTICSRGSEIFVGGSSFAGENVARWNGTDWEDIGAGVIGGAVVYTLHTYNGRVLAAGSVQNGLLEWTGSTWEPFEGFTSSGIVYALEQVGDSLFVGGYFENANGLDAADSVLLWDGTQWTPLGSGVEYLDGIGLITQFEVFDGQIVATGATSLDDERVTAITWNGSAWVPFSGPIGGYLPLSPAALHSFGGELYAGGSFAEASGNLASCIVRSDGGEWLGLGSGGTGVGAIVWDVASHNDDVIVAGGMTVAGDATARGIARWDGLGWSGLGTGLDDRAFALLSLGESDPTLLVGGSFSTAGGLDSPGVASWRDDTGWSAIGGLEGTVRDLAEWNGEVVAVGTFTVIEDPSVTNLASWDGQDWAPIGPSSPDGAVTVAAVHAGRLYVGGEFQVIGGVPASRIASWDGSEWEPLGQGADGPVNALLSYQGDLVVAGSFGQAGGQQTKSVARWDGEGWYGLGAGLEGPVYRLNTYRDRLVAGGGFAASGSETVRRLASWNGEVWSPLGSTMNGTVYGLLEQEGDGDTGSVLYAGGLFYRAGADLSSTNLAAYREPTSQEYVPDANTTLLLHFDGNPFGANLEAPDESFGLSYGPAVFGRGVNLPDGSRLSYPSSGNARSDVGTLEFWILPDWNETTDPAVAFDWGGAGGIHVERSYLSWRFVVNRFGSGDPNGEREVNIPSPQLEDGAWHHCAFTWDSASLRLYLDGRLLDEETVGFDLPSIASSGFWLGRDSGGNELNGRIDEFRISDVVRTTEEIEESFLRGLPDTRGACCVPTGVCVRITDDECDAAGGDFLGQGTVCDTEPCFDRVGACCLEGGSCVVQTAESCLASGGGFQGNESICTPSPCNNNSNGVLFVHAVPELVYSSGFDYCTIENPLAECDSAIVAIDGSGGNHIFYVLGAMAESVIGVTFGIDYDSSLLDVQEYGTCGEFEIPEDAWPAPGSGTAVTWSRTQPPSWEENRIIEVYWFAAYHYGPDPTEFELVAHPTQGAFFADDAVPSVLTPIQCLGSLGFGIDGRSCCGDGVDVLPPEVEFTSGPPAGGFALESDIEICWTGTDNRTAESDLLYSYRLGNDSPSPFLSDSCAAYALGAGNYTFRVTARDLAGNEGTKQLAFSVDLTAPETSISSGPADGGWWYSRTVSFTWTGSDDLSPTNALEYSYRFDGGEWSNFSGATNVVFSDVLDGTHVFDVRARDRAGRIDDSPAGRTFQLGLIDLVATEPAIPDSGFVDRDLALGWRVVNSGTGPAFRPWTDQLRLLDGPSGNPLAVLGSFAAPRDLEPDSSYVRALDVGIPLIAEGDYWIEFTTDSGNLQPEEGGEGNNVVVAGPLTLTFPPHPDLVVDSVSVPIEGVAGESFEVDWAVSNVGDATASGTWTDHVYGSVDDVFGNEDDLLLGSSALTAVIDPGEGYERSRPFTLPSTPGEYHVFVQADAGDVVEEYDGDVGNSTASEGTIVVAPRPYPNLTVAVGDPDSISVVSGTSISFSYTVRNEGTAPTAQGTWQDVVYLFSSPSVGQFQNAGCFSGLTRLGTFANQRYLPIGEQYTQSVEVPIPDDMEGTFYLAVYTDYVPDNCSSCGWGRSCVVPELDETDNGDVSGGFEIVLSPQPDLLVPPASIAFIPNAASGRIFQTAWADSNGGEGPTDVGSWRDYVYLSDDETPEIDGNDLYLGQYQRQGNVLSGGDEDSSPAFSKQLPVDLTGEYFVKIRTDAQNVVSEFGREGNNLAISPDSVSVVLSPAPNLVPITLTAPDSALAGHLTTVQWSVGENTGAEILVASSWDDYAFLSLDGTYDPDDIPLGSARHSTSGDPGSYRLDPYSKSPSFRIPNSVPEGDYRIVLQVDRYDQLFEGFDDDPTENDNEIASLSFPVRVRTTDLLVEVDFGAGFSLPDTAAAGQSVDVSWKVTNVGDVVTPVGSWWDRFYFSTNNTIGSGDPLLANVKRVGALAPGQSYVVEKTIQIPLRGPGAYYFIVATDYLDEVYERGEGNANNRVAEGVVVSGEAADLVVDAIEAPDIGESAQTVRIDWTVRNQGNRFTAASSWVDRVYLSPSTSLTEDSIPIGARTRTASLPADSTYSLGGNFVLPFGIAGFYHVIVATDADDRVFESSDGNNSLQKPMTIEIDPAPLANLQVRVDSVPNTVVSGQSISVGWTVENVGPGPTNTAVWDDAVYLSRDQFLDPSTDLFVGERRHSAVLPSGAQYSELRTFDVPLGTSGPYFVIIRTNYRSSVVEERSDDNTSLYPELVSVVVPEPSDLVISRVLTPIEPLRLGRTTSFSWVARNQGVNPVLGRWFDTAFLSIDPVWSIDDVPIGTFDSGTSGGSLAPGDSASISVEATVPALLPGSYFLVVRGDSRNNIPEANESNNIGVAPQPVSVNTIQLNLTDLPYTDADVRIYEERYYQIQVDDAATIEFAVESVEGSQEGDWLQIFLRREAVPNSGEFDFSATEADRTRQVIRVPETIPGTYYLLARKVRGPGLSTFEVTGEIIPFSITSAEPRTIGASSVTLRVQGSRWTEDTNFVLRHVDSGQQFEPLGTFLESEIAGRLVFDLASAPLGDYELEATAGSEVDALDELLSVVAPDEVVATVDINLGPPIRKGTTGAATALFRNESNRDVPYAIVMTAVAPDSFLSQSIPSFADTTTSDRASLQVRQVLLQNVAAEDEFALPVRARVLREFAGDEFTLGFNAVTFGADDFRTEVVDGYLESLRARILTDAESPGALVDLALSEAWIPEIELSFDTLFSGVGFQDPLPFCEVPASVLLETVTRIGMTEAEPYVRLLRSGSCASFCEWFPGSAVCQAYCELDPSGSGDCGSGEPVLERGEFACRGAGCQEQWPAPAADDPNEKGSRAGYGVENWVAGLAPIDFRIYFENVAEASAAAARVEVIDELRTGFNPGSFRLTRLKIGSRVFDLPGQSFYQTTLDLVAEQGVLLEVTASIDVSSDPPVARWVFNSLDPETGEPPTDGQHGFLPPNLTSPEGEGYVEFRVGSTTQNTGAILENTARIIFDDNQPVDTNVLEFTLDYDVPTTHVLALPDTTDAITFPVSWSVDDPVGGSGIESYSLYVSRDGGPFELYRSGLDTPSTIFTGDPGSTYGLFSRAFDNAGNAEPLKSAPEVVVVVGTRTEVWPGDTDNNGFVDQIDLLPLGQFFGATGPARDDPSLEWVGQLAVLFSPEAATYADGTGDGRVDQNDILPIGLNFGKSRPQSRPATEDEAAPSYALQVPPLAVGEEFEIAIQTPLDWEGAPMGVGFRVDYPAEYCSLDTVLVGSAIDDGEVLTLLRKGGSGTTAAAFTRTRWGSEDRLLGGSDLAVLRFRVERTMETVESIVIRDIAVSDSEQIVRSPEIVVQSPLSRPQAFMVLPVYPNPFKQQAMLRLAVPSDREVQVDLFDVSGRRIARPLERTRLEAGWHVVPIDASALANGVYFYQVDAGADRDADKIVVLR